MSSCRFSRCPCPPQPLLSRVGDRCLQSGTEGLLSFSSRVTGTWCLRWTSLQLKRTWSFLREVTLRISKRAAVSGRSSRTFRSKRPARRSAGSRRSALQNAVRSLSRSPCQVLHSGHCGAKRNAHLLVAAMKTTPMSGVKPSISVSSWFSVCSRSSFVFMPAQGRRHKEAPPARQLNSRYTPIGSLSSTTRTTSRAKQDCRAHRGWRA